MTARRSSAIAVHRGPQFAVVGRLDRLAGLRRVDGVAHFDERPPDAELVDVPGERDPVGRVVRLELAHPAQRDDDVVLADGTDVVDGVDVGDLPLQLGLGLGLSPLQPVAVTWRWKWLTLPPVAWCTLRPLTRSADASRSPTSTGSWARA